MTKAWTPLFLCMQSALADLSEYREVFRLAVVEVDGSELIFHDVLGSEMQTGVRLRMQNVYRDCSGFLARTDDDGEVYERVLRCWAERFGAGAGIPVYNLAQERGAALGVAISKIMGGLLALIHGRNTHLMRELSIVRNEHEQTQEAFARLESFFHQTSRSERTLAFALPVLRDQRSLILVANEDVAQRLPVNSSGICDLVVFVNSSSRVRGGTLVATLSLMESLDVIAEWTLPAERIEAGPLRLSLERALGADRQTPQLKLRWSGPEELILDTSFDHPDARFTPKPDLPTLALEVWKYIPSARAPLHASGILPDARACTVDRWSIGLGLLRGAVAVSHEVDSVVVSEQYQGLFVRPRNGEASVARINNAGPQGLIHLWGGVKTEQATGPDVEYAYMLIPRRKREAVARSGVDFSIGLKSRWLSVPPNVWSELHLFLPEPLKEVNDLYLLSRLSDGAKAEAPPDACFFAMSGSAISGADDEQDDAN